MFCCPRSGRQFDSGFRADQASLAAVPKFAVLCLRCGDCSEMHEFKVADGSLARPAHGQFTLEQAAAAARTRRQ